MVGFFKSNNPFNIILLLVYAFILKLYSFLHPHIPIAQATDGFLYHQLLDFLAPTGKNSPIIYPVITFILIFTQSLTFNSLINNQKLLTRPTYLPGMAYVLITSLFPEWWQLSSTLIINSLLVWVWAMMSGLYNHNRPKSVLFNIGVVVGLCSFLYFPSIAFVILIIFGLVVMRPLRFSEWLVAFLGITTPYYFLLAWIYFSNHWNPKAFIPAISISYPRFQQSFWAWGSLLLLIIPFLISGFYIQSHMLRMLIQIRKSWSVMLLYLLTALLIPFINYNSTFEYWILSAMPLAAFHASAYFYPTKKWLPLVIHWTLFAFIMLLQWGPQ